MAKFDPLDWTHQWDDFEMYMYLDNVGDEEEKPGIRMQVSRRCLEDGAEQWELLYDRKIADWPAGILIGEVNNSLEEQVLREYLDSHPSLVEDEKRFLAAFLQDEGSLDVN